MKKSWQKVQAVILLAVLMFGLAADMNVSAPAAAETKQYVIGVAEAQANDEVTARRMYFENYIAPTYNVKFIFSEVLKDDAATKVFIENCIDAGADAIIDFKSTNRLMARLCEENDVVYVINGSFKQHPEFLEEEFPMFAGAAGNSVAQAADLYKKWLESEASEDGTEGFLVATVMAAEGNEQHMEITRAILEGLQEKYGLTYEQSIENLIRINESANIANDKGILITLYPGSTNKDTWLPGISTLLQTGRYGVFLSAGQTFNKSAQVVDEVEKAFDMDIKIASIGTMGSVLKSAFETVDSKGNPSVNMVTVKVGSVLSGALFALAYNGLTNGCGNLRDANGKPVTLNGNFIAVTSPEQLANIENWDNRDSGAWIMQKEEIDQMLSMNGATIQDMIACIEGLDYEQMNAIVSAR